MLIINWLVKKEYIFYGHLAPLMQMDLLSWGNINKVLCDKEGNIVSLSGADIKVPTNNIISRRIILFYALSKYTRDELNEIIEKTFVDSEVFNTEGEFPKMWDEKMVRKLKRLKK